MWGRDNWIVPPRPHLKAGKGQTWDFKFSSNFGIRHNVPKDSILNCNIQINSNAVICHHPPMCKPMIMLPIWYSSFDNHGLLKFSINREIMKTYGTQSFRGVIGLSTYS